MKFPESKLAHFYLDGLEGIEIGPSIHNPFGLKTKNIGMDLEQFAKEEVRLAGGSIRLDIISEASTLPLKNESEDFVLSSHVIEHCPNFINAVLEWYRVTKTSGYIYLITPFRDALPSDAILPLTDWEHIYKDYLNQSSFEENHENCNYKFGHYHRFTIDTMIEFFIRIFQKRVKLVAHQKIDDKVGNGFTLVFQKKINLSNSFPWKISHANECIEIKLPL
jgi:SAM-dependent methyltransferase